MQHFYEVYGDNLNFQLSMARRRRDLIFEMYAYRHIYIVIFSKLTHAQVLRYGGDKHTSVVGRNKLADQGEKVTMYLSIFQQTELPVDVPIIPEFKF